MLIHNDIIPVSIDTYLYFQKLYEEAVQEQQRIEESLIAHGWIWL